jgi:hypothetical protein
MSCRTTPAGRLSVSFLKHRYGFTDSQSMSLFHASIRKYRTLEIPQEEISASYLRSLEEIKGSINFSLLPSNKKEHLLTKLTSLNNDQADSYKYAISQLIRTADTAKAMIDTSISLAHARQNQRMSLSETFKNYESLINEYYSNRQVIQNSDWLVNNEELLDGYPKDKATQYAINALHSSRRCVSCGRFVGLTSIHSCPPSTSESEASSTTSVVQPPIQVDYSPLNDIMGSRRTEVSRSLRNSSEVETISVTSRKEYSEPVMPISMEEFQERYDAAKLRIAAGEKVPVIDFNEEGSVTGGLSRRNGGNTFGIELEVDFPTEDPEYSEDDWDDSEPSFYGRHNLAAELFRNGVTVSPHIQRWHYIGEDGRPGGEYVDAVNGWICEYDRSVDPFQGLRGVEVKSQILYDEPATWENIKKISEAMRRHNASPTVRTGMHINIGGSEFPNTNPKAHNNLLKIASAYDDTLIRLAHNPASGRQHRGRGYCAPAYLPPEGYASISSARASSNHYQAFNLAHLPSDGENHRNSSRVEVRFWDGATDLGRIQTAVAISTALVELALRGQEPGQETELAGSHSRRFGTAKLEGSDWENATLSFRKFVSLMEIAGLKKESHKDAFFHLFAESRWTRD